MSLPGTGPDRCATLVERLEIRQCVVDSIVKHARCDLPNECCGLLLGTSRVIEQAVPARNLRPSPTRYLVDPADHCAAIRSARTRGLSIVGAYHSHPTGPPVPSETDRREATYPEYVYVIVSPGGETGRSGAIAAYRLKESRTESVCLLRVP